MNIRQLIFTTLSIAAISSLAFTQSSNSKTYVLVHGSWQGKYVWDETKTLLEKTGNTVITLDLPAHGDDQTPVDQVSLESYTKAVVKAIGTRRNVVLVGHSFGGIVVSTVGEAIPYRISKLIYVAGYLPRNGESLFALSQEDQFSKVFQYFVQTGPTVDIKPEGRIDVFCNDCTAFWKTTLLQKHRPEPFAPAATPVKLTPKRFGKIPRYYVETLQDNAVSNQLQKLMISRSPVVSSVQLNTSHSPFLTQPQALADAITGF